MKLLLHICCGPCATHVIELLKKDYDLTCYWYNPNIHPDSEYEIRLEQAKKVCKANNVPLIIADYDKDKWFESVKGYETEPEGGKRCNICFKIRIEKTAQYARLNDYDIIATTLTIGPMKSASRINRIGKKAAWLYDTKFLEADFKKQGGFNHSVKLSKELDLYRQNYCGCLFSVIKEKNKKIKNLPLFLFSFFLRFLLCFFSHCFLFLNNSFHCFLFHCFFLFSLFTATSHLSSSNIAILV